MKKTKKPVKKTKPKTPAKAVKKLVKKVPAKKTAPKNYFLPAKNMPNIHEEEFDEEPEPEWDDYGDNSVLMAKEAKRIKALTINGHTVANMRAVCMNDEENESRWGFYQPSGKVEGTPYMQFKPFGFYNDGWWTIPLCMSAAADYLGMCGYLSKNIE